MSADYDLNIRPANAQRRREMLMDEAATREPIQRAQIGHVAAQRHDPPFVNSTTFWHDAERHGVAFHSDIAGRVRANEERHPRVCLEASVCDRVLPSNVALEFSPQYENVIADSTVHVFDNPAEKRRARYGLVDMYILAMASCREHRPITDQELKRTSVYVIQIESWSSKRNRDDRAGQSDEWPQLGMEWFR